MDDDDLDELDRLLFETDGMLLSELDGFLAGVAVSPDLVAPSQWLPRVWRSGTPAFENEDESRRFVDLVMRHYNDILTSLDQPDGFRPVFDLDPVNDDTLWEIWIEGFAAAMKLAPRGWNRLRGSDDASGKAAMRGIAELIAIVDRLVEVTEDDERHWDQNAPALIAMWVPMLHKWRLENDWNKATGKVGRNDPCPCASGKKYKKCCGLN